MKIKIIIAVIAIVGTLGLTGCKPKETTVSGQIFIVTRSSENIKLGLVEVQLIEKQQVAEFLQTKQAMIDSEIASRKQEYAAAKSDDKKAAADFNAFQTNSNPLKKSDCIEMKTQHENILNELSNMTEKVNSINKEGDKLAGEFCNALHAYEGVCRTSESENYLLLAIKKVGEQKEFAKKSNQANPELTKDTVADNSFLNAYSLMSVETENLIAASLSGNKNTLRRRLLGIIEFYQEYTLVSGMGVNEATNFMTKTLEALGGMFIDSSLKGEDAIECKELCLHTAQIHAEEQRQNGITGAGPVRPNGTSEEAAKIKTKSLDEKLNKIASDAEMQGKPFADKLAAAIIRFKTATIKNFEPFPKAETYFADFTPLVMQKTLTDADGKFSICYPRDKAFTIFASAERELGDKKEKYFWLINAPSGAENAQILLSNNNFVYNDPDGYFKIKPQPEAQPTP